MGEKQKLNVRTENLGVSHCWGSHLSFFLTVPKRAETGILLHFSCVRSGELVLFYLVQEIAAKIYLCGVFCRKGNRSEKGLESHVALAKIMLSEITGYLKFGQTSLRMRLSTPD